MNVIGALFYKIIQNIIQNLTKILLTLYFTSLLSLLLLSIVPTVLIDAEGVISMLSSSKNEIPFKLLCDCESLKPIALSVRWLSGFVIGLEADESPPRLNGFRLV